MRRSLRVFFLGIRKGDWRHLSSELKMTTRSEDSAMLMRSLRREVPKPPGDGLGAAGTLSNPNERAHWNGFSLVKYLVEVWIHRRLARLGLLQRRPGPKSIYRWSAGQPAQFITGVWFRVYVRIYSLITSSATFFVFIVKCPDLVDVPLSCVLVGPRHSSFFRSWTVAMRYNVHPLIAFARVSV